MTQVVFYVARAGECQAVTAVRTAAAIRMAAVRMAAAIRMAAARMAAARR
jgi:hypothetical protein